MNSKRLIFCIILILSIFRVSAQRTDSKLRMGVELEKDITKKFKGSIEGEYRMHKNISATDKIFIEPALSYSVLKNVDIGLIWRVLLSEGNSVALLNKQRYAFYSRYECKYLDFEFDVKWTLQYGFDDITNPTFSKNQNFVGRYALNIEYDWFGQKISPLLKYELFHHLNHPNGDIINQWRIKIGASYKISKRSELEGYYMFENELNVAYPVDAHIWGGKYSYEL